MADKIRITAIGIGGCGRKLLADVVSSGVNISRSFALDSDITDESNILETVAIGENILNGVGTNGNIELAEKAVASSLRIIERTVADSDILLIFVGLGGGIGTVAAPVVAQCAKESGALVVSFAAMPVKFGGEERIKTAERGLKKLMSFSDSVFTVRSDAFALENSMAIVNSQNVFTPSVREIIGLLDFAKNQGADSLNTADVLLHRERIMSIEPSDVMSFFSGGKKISFGMGIASGENRAKRAAAIAVSSVTAIDLGKASECIISISGKNVIMGEILSVVSAIKKKISFDANIIVANCFTDDLGDNLKIVLFAAIEKEKLVGEESFEPLEKSKQADEKPESLGDEIRKALTKPRHIAPKHLILPLGILYRHSQSIRDGQNRVKSGSLGSVGTRKNTVSLYDTILQIIDRFYSNKYTFPIGIDKDGNTVISNLNDTPSILIGGITGSGKSMFIHSLLISLLLKCSPEELKVAIIDPKRIEYAAYRELSQHLYSSIAYEDEDIFELLDKLNKEMERRFELLSESGFFHIDKYGIVCAGSESLSRIVVVIDEFSDLIRGHESHRFEKAVAGLVSKGQAVGIHVLAATQRINANVISGTIKSVFPCTVAFKTLDALSSRIIVNEEGAQDLAGNGDMLFLADQNGELVHLKGAYVSERDVFAVTNFIKISDGKDALFFSALAIAVKRNSLDYVDLQREFGVGYARACRILDQLEECEFINKSGRNESFKPTISEIQFEDLFGDLNWYL